VATKLNPPVTKKDHSQGPEQAPLTLVEYGDYQCSHCGEAYPIIKRIQKKFSKQLKFIFRNFPLSEAHEYAFQAAMAAEAAARQQKFWEMHDALYEHQAFLEKEDLIKYAKKLGLALKEFENDIQDKSLGDKIEADFESGIRSGVNGTPSFYINGFKYEGDYDFESMTEILSGLLTQK
jgi:protein-disulfide isomerase